MASYFARIHGGDMCLNIGENTLTYLKRIFRTRPKKTLKMWKLIISEQTSTAVAFKVLN